MPRHLETFSTCAGPDLARPHTRLGGFTGVFISAYYSNGTLTIIGGVAYALGLIFLGNPLTWCLTAAAIIVAAVEIKHWYYNERLLCIRERDCLIGTVISPPGPPSTDGDMKLNIMPAPFPKAELEIMLINHIDRNRAMLSDNANFNNDQTPEGDSFFSGGAPFVPSATDMMGNRTLLVDYMNELRAPIGDYRSNMFNQIMTGVVDTMMDDPNRNFFERFYRKDATEITDAATFNYIPVDFENINWQAVDAQSSLLSNNPVTLDNDVPLNPMFRIGSPSKEPIVPYMHCEIEGNYIEILMNDIIVAASGFLVGCVLGPLAGAALGFLAWLFKKLIDWITGNDGNATEPDVDWSDPSFPGYGGVAENTGDVVVVYGNWIMDAEHQQYFEIHPIRAYYIIARNGDDVGDPILVDDNQGQVVVGGNFDPAQITADIAAEICTIVERAEAANPDSDVVVSSARGLSYGMKAGYS